MILEQLRLTNFRNYEQVDLSFNKNVNIFIGKNGAGKTNILESIYALAITKSHRVIEEEKMIQNEKSFFKINATFSSDTILKETYEFILNKGQKNIKKNGNEIKKLSDYLSNINVILFSPESIELVKGTPNYRRKFLNIEIGQINNEYLKVLNEYNHYLKIRNDLLKKMQKQESVDEVYFNIITDKIISRAIKIYKARKNFIDSINNQIDKVFYQLAKIKNLQVNYETNISLNDFENLSKYMLEKYRKNLKKEIQLGSTIYGPHRDDFSFFVDKKNMLEYGSQGQQRLIALSFKLSEIKIFKECTKRKPLILLDDVFSELDELKKNNILNKIPKDFQIFITTNDLTNIQEKYLKVAKVFIVNNGNIKIKRGGKHE